MTPFLDTANAAPRTAEDETRFARSLASILANDWRGSPLAVLGEWQRVLADDRRRRAWGVILERLEVLFRCGRAVPLDGPMIGVTLHVRESDLLRDVARWLGRERSLLAEVQWLAALWNATFADTGIWMGKTFEPVAREAFAARCGGNAAALATYDPATCRIGRNFFREAARRGAIQALGLPVLSRLWGLKERPQDAAAPGFDGALRVENLEKERRIPYTRTGGRFLSNLATSVLDGVGPKRVYALDYRWPELEPAYPLTRLVDEIVQVADGVFLGQLLLATRRYALGRIRAALPLGRALDLPIGEPYRGLPAAEYRYGHNGWFLMIDAALAKEAFGDDAFPSLRPRPGEPAFEALGYGTVPDQGPGWPPAAA